MSDAQLILRRDPELSSLFKELKGWEYNELKRDIEENGVKTPIIVADDGTIIDGYTRHKIWGELGFYPWDIPYEIRHYDTREEMIQDAITLNVLRRHLGRNQRAYFAMTYLLPKEKKKAEKRVGGRPKKGENPPADLQEDSDKPHTREAYTRAAKQVGLSGRTLRKAERVFKEAPDKTRRKVLTDQLSIDKVFQDLERESAHEKALAETGLTSEEFDRWDKQRKKNVKSDKEQQTLIDFYGVGAINDVFMRMKVTSFETRRKYMQRYVMRLHAKAPEDLKRHIIGGLEY